MKVFIFYNCRTYPTKATYLHYLYSFKNYSDHEVYYQNFYYDQTTDFFNAIKPDIVIFYLLVFWDEEDFMQKIKQLKTAHMEKAVKVAFFQDEYSRTLYSVKLVNEFKISNVYTVAPKSEWKKIYEGMCDGVVIEQVLTAYIDDVDLRRSMGVNNINRTIDISYRTALDSPYHVGKFGLLKKELGSKVQKKAAQYGLVTDISTSEKNMKFGDAWFDFLLKSKYVLGMESGASLLDKDGSIFKKVKDYVTKYPTASFEQTEKHCFPGKDGNLALKAISPRHLEACLTKTCQILIEGEYNGILKPWKHYLPLKSDFSNLSEILSIVKDNTLRKKIVANAYKDIAQNAAYKYSKFIPDFFAHLMKKYPKLRRKKSNKNSHLFQLFDKWTWLVAYFVSINHTIAILLMKVYFKAKKLALSFI